MQNSPSTLLALGVALVLVFILPLITLTGRIDNVSQENLQKIVDELVIDVSNTGKLTRARFQEFEIELDSTGNNSYDIEIQIQHIDENPGKKTAQAQYTKIGENVYYSEYTTQILNQIGIKTDNNDVDTNNDVILLKEGDIITVEVKNSNSTTAQTLKSSFLGFSNVGEYTIIASASRMVTVKGVKD